MRKFALLFGLLILLISTGQAARADKFIPTIYSDGVSCPHQCDAHVVFNRAHNGTRYASSPDSPRTSPQPCQNGVACRICFDDADGTCMTAIYRGEGPDKWRFDFTPAFYETTCNAPGLPEAFAGECRSFSRQYAKLTAHHVYCLTEPTSPGCSAVLKSAEEAKVADRHLWDECRQLGQAPFNIKYSSRPALQRSNDCAYEKHGTGGPNSKGQKWRRLLPAACQPGAYVDRSGLDCCDSNKMSLGGLGKECSIYSVSRP